MATDDAGEVCERLIAAAADAAKLELWSDQKAPDRLRAAAAHLLDAVTDLRDALELTKELEAEGVSIPFGVLDAETNEDEIVPHTSMWAAYRQLIDAAQFMSAASVVPPWQDEPAGWRPVADELTYALWHVSALECRAKEFGANGERPTLMLGGAASRDDGAELTPTTTQSRAAQSVAVADDQPIVPSAHDDGSRATPPIEHVRVEAGDLDASSTSSPQTGASSTAHLHQ